MHPAALGSIILVVIVVVAVVVVHVVAAALVVVIIPVVVVVVVVGRQIQKVIGMVVVVRIGIFQIGAFVVSCCATGGAGR